MHKHKTKCNCAANSNFRVFHVNIRNKTRLYKGYDPKLAITTLIVLPRVNTELEETHQNSKEYDHTFLFLTWLCDRNILNLPGKATWISCANNIKTTLFIGYDDMILE